MAESRIRDMDMAKSMMELTKNNIISEAAQAMLSQANQTNEECFFSLSKIKGIFL